MNWKMPFMGALIIAMAAGGLWSLGGGAKKGHAERRSQILDFRPTQVERIAGPLQIQGHPAKGLRFSGPQGQLELALSEALLTQAAQADQSAQAPQGSFGVQAQWQGQDYEPQRLELTINRAEPDLSLLDLRLQGEFAVPGEPQRLVSIDLPVLVTTPQ